MRRNLGVEDRLFRLVLAVSILPLCLVLEGPAGLLGWLGFGPLATASLGWSPLYALFGIRSRRAATDASPGQRVGEAIPAA